MASYIVSETFWTRDWTSRESVYFVSTAWRKVIYCMGTGTSWHPWEFHQNEFIGCSDLGEVHQRHMSLEGLIVYLEATNRSKAVDHLQMFCEDADIEWPPATAAMDLYLQQKDQIQDKFIRWMSFRHHYKLLLTDSDGKTVLMVGGDGSLWHYGTKLAGPDPALAGATVYWDVKCQEEMDIIWRTTN